MVKLHVKRGDESQFLFETTTSIPIDDLTRQLALIYNGRLKVHRICNGTDAQGLSISSECLCSSRDGHVG